MAALLSTVSGCALVSGRTTVTVVVPSLPPHIESVGRDAVWALAVPSSGAAVSRWILDAPVQDATRAAIRLLKRPVVPVVLSVDSALAPAETLKAGGFYPLDLDAGGELRLTWADGMLASLIVSYVDSGGRAEWIDLAGLRKKILDATEGNAWGIDRAALATGIGCEAISPSVIRTARSHTLALPLPPGLWYWINPLLARPLRSRRNAATPVDATEGYHCLLEQSGESVAQLYVGNDEWAMVVEEGGMRRITRSEVFAR